MPRSSKGILGVTRKKAVLFSFTSRQGEECPSDSEDSDYLPGRNLSDEDDEGLMEKIEKTFLKRKLKSKNNDSDSDEPKPIMTKRSKKSRGPEFAFPDTCVYNLPPELWLKIFKYAVCSNAVNSFVARASRVCRMWSDLCHDPSLYRSLELSVDNRVMTTSRVESLVQRDLSLCNHLSLAGQHKLKIKDFTTILEAIPNLTSLDLTNCHVVNAHLIGKDVSKYSLQILNLSFTRGFVLHPKVNLTYPALDALFKHCGSNLAELRLSRQGCLRKSVADLLHTLGNNCPNLQELDISLCSHAGENFERCKVDIVVLMKGCPRLRELRLDGFSLVNQGSDMEHDMPRLPELKVFSQCYQSVGQIDDDAIFYGIMERALNIQEISISGSDLLPYEISSFVNSVQILDMSGMKWGRNYNDNVVKCMEHWGKNLVTLDLSHNTFPEVNDALALYAGLDNPPLEAINLAASSVSSRTVVQVLESCKALQRIDLTSCRDLPRGTKRIFLKVEFPFLKKQLKNEIKQTVEDLESEESESESEYESDSD